MVLEKLSALLSDQYGCDPEDVTMAATLDELNITDREREELAFILGEVYGVEIPQEELAAFATVEDFVGYIEDRL